MGNEDQLPHVTEEQAAMDKSMGNTPPDIEQGTPVQEVYSHLTSALSYTCYTAVGEKELTQMIVIRSSSETKRRKRKRPKSSRKT